MNDILFEPCVLPDSAESLRDDVRSFLGEELVDHSPLQRSASWDGFDPELSRRMGARGFIGLNIPERYGGAGRSMLDRYVVYEELLAAGAPAGFHWFADRQSAPMLLRYGTESQRQFFLPRICRGEVCFCIGMSEPDAGSDLASIRAHAEGVDEGWQVNGTKVWTTNAHRGDYMITLLRTDSSAESRHAGLSQFIVDLKNTSGLTISPVTDLSGRQHFNEVTFEDAFIPKAMLIGEEGAGWQQVTAELALERSGPERYLSCYVLFTELLAQLASHPDDTAVAKIGQVMADLITLRSMSLSVAGMLDRGADPMLQASMVKVLGTRFEQSLPGIAESLSNLRPDAGPEATDYQQVLASLTMLAPSFSLRAGTTEILLGIIARGLGLR